MQVNSDWNMLGTSESLEKELSLKFAGPGWYLTATDSMLIVPVEYGETPWKQKWPVGTMFRAYVWNAPLSETIFGAASIPPTRLDQR